MSLFTDRGGYFPPDAKDIALHQQLFRYAEDMQALIDDHTELEKKHRVLQKAFDRTSSTFRSLDRLLDKAPDLYLITDPDGRIRHGNPACRALGSLEALIDSNLLDYARTESRTCMRQCIEAALQTDHTMPISPCPSETLYLNTLSGQRLIATLSSVQSFEDDQRAHIHWLLRDVTREREKEFENQLASMVYSNATEAILITDIKGNILAVNPAFTTITGYAADEVIGKTPKLLSSGIHDTAFYAAMWQQLSTNCTWQANIFNRNKNGQIIPLRVTVNAVKNATDEVLSYIAIYTDLTQLHEAEKQLNFLAYHDPLTRLPNRSLFQDRLHQTLVSARRGVYEFTLFFIDLDRFKPINDTLGHQAGDLVLREIAQRLEQSVRDVDTVARVGGDEFVIIAPGLYGQDHVFKLGQKILDQLSRPIQYGDRKLALGCSIGAACFPADGEDEDRLIQHADLAMYRAKENGGGQLIRFTDMEDETSSANLSVETELGKALTRNQLSLVYQPQILVAGTEKPVGVEALLRWDHPTLGRVSPEVFIPVAERTGSILAIGTWVLRSACTQLALWQAQGIVGLRMSVNISSRQLRDPGFIDTVREAIQSTGIGSANLELEITERELLLDLDVGFSHLNALRNLGVRIAVDDFGTGYSSLARLQHLPVDLLKIDQAFIKNIGQDEQSATIASCIVDMGRALHLDIIAEGVEKKGQLNTLRQIGCHLIQGYLLAEPMPPEMALDFLQSRSLPTLGVASPPSS